MQSNIYSKTTMQRQLLDPILNHFISVENEIQNKNFKTKKLFYYIIDLDLHLLLVLTNFILDLFQIIPFLFFNHVVSHAEFYVHPSL